MEPTVFSLALLVTLLSLDSTAFGQIMISQPIAGGWIMGVAVGRPLEGLFAGTLLQLLCMTELRVGASIPPDGSLAGLTGVAVYLGRPAAGPLSDMAVLGIAVLLFFPVAYVGRWAEIMVLRANRIWTPLAASLLERGRTGRAQLAMVGGLLFFLLKAFIVVTSTLLLARWLLARAGDGAAVFEPFLEILARVTPFAGLGVVAARQSPGRVTALAGLAAGLVVGWGLLG
jgi:mannose/fructose/N-acetylgalactosamine-specific phosphotransferase system component IIC